MSNLDPEQFPPFCSSLVLLRDLFSIPLPQVFEQDDQADQGPQTQSSGNKPILHNDMKPKPRGINFVTYCSIGCHWLPLELKCTWKLVAFRMFVAIGTKLSFEFILPIEVAI